MTSFSVGDRVSHEGRLGTITDLQFVAGGGEWHVAWDDGGDTWSDLRGGGWKRVAAKTEPRVYRADYVGAHYPLETPYGVVTIQPLGWGVRVETRFKYGPAMPTEWSADAECDPPLTVNGRASRLGLVDYHVDENGVLADGPKWHQVIGGDMTSNALGKVLGVLRPLVLAWLGEHAAEFTATRVAYLSNRARTCEESIRELENALDVYRTRLAAIESGNMDVSPYMNGGRRLNVGDDS